MVEFEIDFDQAQMRHVQECFRLAGRRAGGDAAIAAAVNRAADSAKAEFKRQIRKSYTPKASEVGKTINTGSRASAGDPVAQLKFMSAPLKLKDFNVMPKKPSKRELVVAAIQQGNDKDFKYSFVAKMKSGHIGVFSRIRGSHAEGEPATKTNKGRKHPGKVHREKIRERYSLSVTQMAQPDTQTFDAAMAFAEEMLTKRLDHELQRMLNGR